MSIHGILIPIIQAKLTHPKPSWRWIFPAISIMTFLICIVAFPMQQTIDSSHVFTCTIFMFSVIFGYLFITRIENTLLELGWAILAYSILLFFITSFLTLPEIFIDGILTLSFPVTIFLIVKSLNSIWNENKKSRIHAKSFKTDYHIISGRYQNLFTQSREAIFLANREGKLTNVNPAALKLTGYTRDEFLELNLCSLFSESKDRIHFIQEMDQNDSISEFEVKLMRKDGSVLTCLLDATNQHSKSHWNASYHCILRNITDQEQVHQELQASEERLRSTIQSMNDLIFTTDLSGLIITYQPPKHWLDQRSADVFINHRIDEVMPDRMIKNLNHAIECLSLENTKYQFEYSMEKDGRELWLNTVMTGQYEPDGKLIYVTVVQRDVTDQHRADRELHEINAALAESKLRTEKMMEELGKTSNELQLALESAREADRMKSEFLANTSHELRTPLNSIIGFLKLVIDGLCVSDEEERNFLNNALQSSHLLLSLINDVLDIAKIEAGKMEVILEPVSIRNIFDEVYTLTHVQTEQKKLYLKTTMSDENILVQADFHKLQQVLLNLVGNSVKFTSFGGIELAAERIKDSQEVRISVTDTGVGIANDVQKNVFKKFIQADGSTSRKYGGTGLGLAISKSLIELMKGSIMLKSDGPGNGTTLSFTLPAYRQEFLPNDAVRSKAN